ncbi:MAG: fatty acid desaturase [Betaproteobacteria bacterium]|nr:fatty acid desaturase [Betaproteobacteria bacterium]MDH3436684.1 fatty acid desaturase [Betaproteobacteria bacterium]
MLTGVLDLLTGVWDLPWWGLVVYALVVTHITIAAVTIFLHRCQAHRALDLHPIVSHFFRFWLWLTTGMVTKEWTAIHRKHHAKCETVEDPHSPQIYGIRKVLLEGAELYRKESRNQETLERYGRGTPDDWIERNLYKRRSTLGIYSMMAINLVLLGPIGLTIWAVQMMWIPVFAAGVINGLGHYWGYRTFQPEDASTNIVPWGILIGGEELHNNHHAYASSARLSNRWYEFDIGWLYIRLLQSVGLAQVKKVAPELRLDKGKTSCDLETVQAVITHRYDVLARYAKSLRRTCAAEMQALRARAVRIDRNAISRMLHRDASTLPSSEQDAVHEALRNSKVLETIYQMRQELAALWQRSNVSKEQLVHQLEDWCARAEQSGIEALEQFSRRLRCYA